MKKYLLAFLIGLMFVPSATYAVGVSWDWTGAVLRPFQTMWNSPVLVPSINATSTTATSTFPIASTTKFCIGTDCRTAWPAGGGSNWVLVNGALTPSSTVGVRVNASSTIGDGNGEGGLTVLGHATTTGHIHVQGTGTSTFAGTVSIGTASSAARLNVQSQGTEDVLNLFETGGQEIMTVLENGNVGVGVTAPGRLFEIGGITQPRLSIRSTSNSGDGRILFGDVANDSSGQIAYSHTGDAMDFYTGGTVKMQFGASTGALLRTGLFIGAVGNTAPTEGLAVVGDVGIGTTTPVARLAVTGTSSSNALSSIFIVASSTNTNLFKVNGAGHVAVGGATPSVSSCGTSPSISGNDTAGTVTVGSGVVTTCDVTFAVARATTSRFIGITPNSPVPSSISAKSTTGFTVTFASTMGDGKFDYFVVETTP